MFTWLNKQRVQSDRGFVVQFTGRFTAEYREGNKVLTLHIEGGMHDGMACILLDPDAFCRWDHDSPMTFISAEEEERMLENFKEALEFQGLKLVLERP